MRAQPVRSPRNARLKAVRAVRAGKDRAHVLLEGRHLLAEARAARAELAWVLHDEEGLDAQAQELADACAADGVEVAACPRELLDPLSDLDSPRGLLAMAVRPRVDREALLRATAQSGGLVLVAAGVQDPGNLGALVRVAAGLGASGFVSLKGSASPWHPRALRGASGTTFRLPVAEAWEARAFVQDLLDFGVQLWCADASGRDLRSAEAASALALVLGEEGRGIPDELLRSSTEVVAIPLQRGVESLNVATAAAVLAWVLGSRS